MELGEGGEEVLGAADVVLDGLEAVSEAFADEAGGGEVVALVELGGGEEAVDAREVVEADGVEVEVGVGLWRDVPKQGVFDVLEAGLADEAVDLITESEEVLGKVKAVLTCDACNESNLGTSGFRAYC